MHKAFPLPKSSLLTSSILSALLLAGCTTVSTLSPPAGSARPAAPPSSTARGVVSAADPRAAEAGAQMLRQGGSATDAALATMLALTVVEPQSSGVGGGGFYVHANPEGEVETLDGREAAPAAAGPEWFLGDDGQPLPFPQAVVTGLSIGVPGSLALAAEAHEKHGRLAWRTLFAPAIALASGGFAVTERLHATLVRAKDRAALTPEGMALFYDASGTPLPVGTIVRNPELARTLEEIATRGAQGFYSSPNAAALASAIAEATPKAGAMRASDITSYEAMWRPALCGAYRGYRICGMGPPSSGETTVYAILKQLERFDLAALGPDSPVSWHLFAESQRLAYADRELYLADRDFVTVPVSGLMDGDYLEQRGTLISADSRMEAVAPGQPDETLARTADGDEPVESGTSHFVAVDSDGNAVSYTSTIEGPFGSGHMHGGFYLNNELTDFSFRPEIGGMPVANRVEGGKRPRSSMAPTIVFDPEGRMVLAIGAAGGGTIPVQVAKALIGIIDWGLPASAAIALPGLYAPGDTIMVETDSPLLRMRGALEALGHDVEVRPLPFKANAAQLVNGVWVGAADPRSEGTWVAE